MADTQVIASTSEEKVVLKLDQLAIDDDKKNANKLLDEPEDSNIRAVTSGDTPYTSAVYFKDLKLSEELLKGLYVEMKFQKLSKIQGISLPMILTRPYKDLIAQAPNGSGKTTCFVLGMLSRVDPNLKTTQALCICPTRELSIQNMEVLRKMGKYSGITSMCAIPGDKSIKRGERILSQIVIGTPGTLKRYMSNRNLIVNDMKILVFDEADHMLAQDGFQDDSLRMMKDITKVSPQCQVLLFSATFNEAVKNFVSKTVKNAHNQLFVKKEELSLASVKQFKVTCPNEAAKLLVVKDRILEFANKLGQAIIFAKSKRSAIMLHKSLTEMGYEVTTVHSDLSIEDRDVVIKEFKEGLTQVLIATDLLSRGFDQEEVNLVVNYDLPVKHKNPSEPDYEVYLHRIGRAGRYGRKGAFFTFVMEGRDQMILDKIDSYFGTKITEVPPSNSEEDFKAAMKVAGLL